MRAAIRIALVVSGTLALLVAAGFLLNWGVVTRWWPLPAYGLSRVFIASMLAAVALPVLWIALSGELAAMRGGAANIAVSAGAIGAYALWRAGSGGPPRLVSLAMAALLIAAAAAALWVYARRQRFRDQRPMGLLLRVSFGLFATVLTLVGSLLVLRVPGIFPWPLDSDSSVVYGWFFLGAAVYFIDGIVQPLRANAVGQMTGFLAYDLVLIIPFVQYWPVAQGQARLSLAIYLGVLLYSGLLAAWFLFSNGRRLARPHRARAA